MSRYLLPSFFTLATLSLTVAYAETLQPAPDQMQGQSSSSSYQSSSSSSTMISQQSIDNQSLATSGEIVVGPDASTSVLPRLSVGQANSAITILNPSPKPITFSSPMLSASYEVAPNSQRTIQIDRAQTASLTQGQEVAYYINDAEGNQLASSSFVNNQNIATMVDTNTQVASSETTTTTTESTATTEQTQPTSRRATVRGFW